MEFKTYTMEECDRFSGAKAILGKVVSICSEISYYHAKSEEEQEAINKFEWPYDIMRMNLTVDDSEKIDWIYKEVKPLIYGENPKLTFEYILNNPNNGKIF